MDGTHTHWRMTINNYDETDLALVQQAYPDFIRKIVYTLEKGENGTPHIQAFIKMKRDCRFSFMKKLFPRGNFGALTTADYKLNAERYAQKLDATAESPAIIQNGDPAHCVEGAIRKVFEWIFRNVIDDHQRIDYLPQFRKSAERELVREDFTLAKIFVSSTYKTMWKEFGQEMYANYFHTHTHTHSREKFSQHDITNKNGLGTDASISGTEDTDSISSDESSSRHGSI